MSSRLTGFYRQDPQGRLARLSRAFEVTDEMRAAWTAGGGLTLEEAEPLIENVVGTFALPLGVAVNFRINGVERVVPLAVEEPSVVAAVSHMAALTWEEGVTAEADPSWMVGQLQLVEVPDLPLALRRVEQARPALLEEAAALMPRLTRRGGGPRALTARVIEPDLGEGGEPTLVVEVTVDTLDAMGANLVNSLMEGLAPRAAELTGGRPLLRILTNLCDQRLTRAHVRVREEALARPDRDVPADMVRAWQMAAADPWRAATHNKGIMNGVDSLAVATGQDWRAIEAACHAFAARSGRYRPLSRLWRPGDGHLWASCELPLAVGTVGGLRRVHQGVAANLALLGEPSARQLAEIMAAVGLLQNLAALYALVTDGIQRGHMALHARSVAAAAGASPQEIEELAAALVEGGEISLDAARRLLAEGRP